MGFSPRKGQLWWSRPLRVQALSIRPRDQGLALRDGLDSLCRFPHGLPVRLRRLGRVARSTGGTGGRDLGKRTWRIPRLCFEAMRPAKSPLLFMILIPLVGNNTRILIFHFFPKFLSCPTKLPTEGRVETGRMRSE